MYKMSKTHAQIGENEERPTSGVLTNLLKSTLNQNYYKKSKTH